MKNPRFELVTQDSFTRINSDVYGNPRYAVHYLALSKPIDQEFSFNDYNNALAIFKDIIPGSRKYNVKAFCGGVSVQSYSIQTEGVDQINLYNTMIFISDLLPDHEVIESKFLNHDHKMMSFFITDKNNEKTNIFLENGSGEYAIRHALALKSLISFNDVKGSK